MKRVFSYLLAVCMILTLLPVSASAGACLPDIYGFTKELSVAAYKTLKSGRYRAVYEDDAWWYKFVTDDYQLRVRISAFSGDGIDLNSYAGLNSRLSSTIASTDNPSDENSFVYKERKRSSCTVTTPPPKSGLSYGKGTATKTTWTTYLTHLQFTSGVSEAQVTLKCKMIDSLSFEYADMVYENNVFAGGVGYVKPSTAAQYNAALTRTGGNSITPHFRVSVSNPTKNEYAFLNMMDCHVLGSNPGKKKVDVAKNITVAFATATDIGIAIATSGESKAVEVTTALLSNIINYTVDMTVTSAENSKNSAYAYIDKTSIALGERRTLKSTIASPIQLKYNGDYFQSEIYLNRSTRGTGQTISVSFWA